MFVGVLETTSCGLLLHNNTKFYVQRANECTSLSLAHPLVCVGCLSAQVRHAVRSFLQNSPTQHLLLFMSGHGEQTKNPGEVVEESFLLPGRFEQEYYTDADFTEDIEKMPNGKKLYIVVHSCHSGGMLNTWDMAKHKWVVVFASAEADILAEWNSDEDSPSFVKSFCKYAKPGTRLCEIGDGIWQEQADVKKRIRPAFLPMRPEMASARFLSAM